MNDLDNVKAIGLRLVEDSQEQELAGRRGVINELFPFVYEASKRMSSRAISRWLEANGVKLSPSTIAKALREPEPFWQEILDEIEPAALIYARAHNVNPEDILANHDMFLGLKGQPPILECSDEAPNNLGDALDRYENAYATLQEDWFSMPEASIKTCLANAEFGADEKSRKNVSVQSEKEKNEK